MNGYCLSQVVVCFVLLFLDFSAAGHFWTLAGSSSFCFWTNSVSNGHTQYTFLYQTGEANERSLVLFDSIWSRENRLVDCITTNDQAVTKSYVSKCWEPGGRPFSETPVGRFNISELVEPAGPCVTVGRLAGLRTSVRRSRDLESVDNKMASMQPNSGESSGPKLRRAKRAWMIPGTLWCGAGNKALNFSDLGVFEETDKCCREHDHCKDSIASFGFNYGVFNTNIFTLSHCGCDTKFRQCLHKANDSMANVVGYGYFNVLKMRCFEFSQKMQCAERTWWGMCKFHQLAKYALVKDATYYNSTSPESEGDIQRLINYHTISVGNRTFTTGSPMSSTTLTEGTKTARGESLTVSGAQRTFSIVNNPKLNSETPQTVLPLAETTSPQTTDLLQTQRTHSPKTPARNAPQTPTTDSSQTQMTDSPQSPTTDSSQTLRTDSPQSPTTDSSQTQRTDLPQTPTTDLSQTQRTDSPLTPTTESSQTQKTDSPQTPTTDSSQTQRTDSPLTPTSDSSQTQRTDSPLTPTTDSSQTLRTDSPLTPTTDSSQTQRTDSPLTPTTDSSQTQRTDSPLTPTTDSSQTLRTDSPLTPTTDSSQTQRTDSPQTPTTDSSQTLRTDSPLTPTTDSSQTQRTDSPLTPTTDSSQTQRTDSPLTPTADSSQTQKTDSPLTPTTDSSQTQRTDSPQTKTPDLSHTPKKDSPRTQTTLLSQTETTDTPHMPTKDSPRISTTGSWQTQTTAAPKTHLQPDTRPKGKLETCESYKDLDSCRHQILGMQEKFGLHNTEFPTLYHCNCTARLAKEFAGQDKVDGIHSLLLDFVSQYCFILPLNCSHESCSFSSAEVPQLRRWTTDVTGGRPLVASKRKAKRFNTKRSKRKDSSFRLYKKCLRMHSKLQKHSPPKRQTLQ